MVYILPRCTGINFIGNVCDKKTDELGYVMIHDPLDRINTIRYGCALHFETMINDLMVVENGRQNQINALHQRIKKVKLELEHGASMSDQRKSIREAIENGSTPPTFKSINVLKIEINQLWTQAKNHQEVQKHERNKICRFCRYPLKDPENVQDQIGKKYAVADFKGVLGYRRLDALFHTECLISWYTSKFAVDEKEMLSVQPRRAKQQTIFSSIEE